MPSFDAALRGVSSSLHRTFPGRFIWSIYFRYLQDAARTKTIPPRGFRSRDSLNPFESTYPRNLSIENTSFSHKGRSITNVATSKRGHNQSRFPLLTGTDLLPREMQFACLLSCLRNVRRTSEFIKDFYEQFTLRYFLIVVHFNRINDVLLSLFLQLLNMMYNKFGRREEHPLDRNSPIFQFSSEDFARARVVFLESPGIRESPEKSTTQAVAADEKTPL